MKIENIEIGLQSFKAYFQPETFNENDNTVELVWTTGAKVARFNYAVGRYSQELSLKKSDVRLDRLRAGAPVLNNHGTDFFGGVKDLNDVLGVVEKVELRKDADGNRKGFAVVRFSDREEIRSIVSDIKKGILRNVSVGFIIHENEEMKPDEDGTRNFRAIDWEPFELSIVAMPADAKAQVRSNGLVHNCKFHLRGSEMENEETAPTQVTEDQKTMIRSEAPAIDLDQVKREAAEAERNRVSQISRAVKIAGLSEEFSSKLIEDGVSLDQARSFIFDELEKKDKTVATRSSHVAVVRDELDTFKSGVINALSHRANSRRTSLTEEGRQFRGMTMLRMAESFLNMRGVNTRNMSNQEIAGMVLRSGSHTTSDFPELLAEVARKTLRDSYDEAPQTFMPFVRDVEVADFKEISRVSLGDAPSLLEIKESGEYTAGSISEAAEKYFVKTYGRQIVFSRKMLINDDMDAFGRMPEKFGRSSRDLESQLIWDIVNANPVMADGNQLFSVAHGNLAGAGAAISVSTVGDGRTAMRQQKGLDGLRLNVSPVYLTVPTALETVAEQFTGQIVPDQAGNVNPFSGRLKPLAEPRLDDNSLTAWYLMADVAAVDMFEMARLIGESGPMLETMEDWDTDGLKMKVRYDLGAKAIDWRGMFKNPGA